jgi:hypothetical protein
MAFDGKKGLRAPPLRGARCPRRGGVPRWERRPRRRRHRLRYPTRRQRVRCGARRRIPRLDAGESALRILCVGRDTGTAARGRAHAVAHAVRYNRLRGGGVHLPVTRTVVGRCTVTISRPPS